MIKMQEEAAREGTAVAADLALRAAKGDQAAFSLLAERFDPALKAIIASFSLPAEENEDLHQEGLLGLYKATLLFDPSLSSFSTFARLCMRSAVLDAVKKLQKADPSLSTEDFAEPAADPREDPQRILVGKEALSEALCKMNVSLSSLEKKVFLLYLRGMKSEEIAGIVGISRKSAENALSRSRAKLSRL